MTYQEFLQLWEDPAGVIGEMKAGGVRAIRAMVRLSQAEFGKRYGLPYRTVQSWEDPPEAANSRKAPPWVLPMLAYCVAMDQGWLASKAAERRPAEEDEAGDCGY